MLRDTSYRFAAIMSLLVGSACASHTEFTFEVSIAQLDPGIVSVGFDNAFWTPIDGEVTLSQTFSSYQQGVDAGAEEITFSGGSEPFQMGTVRVGLCAQCVYNGCPSLDDIELENVTYSGASNITPETYVCFKCSGKSTVLACP